MNDFASIGILQIIGILLIIAGIAFGNAAGVGGAGIIVPVLLIIFSMEILNASAISNFTIFLSFLLRCYYNFKERHPKRNKPVIDYDTTAIMMPASLMGTKLGVIFHDIFPHPILLILLSVTLFYLTYRSVLQGKKLAKEESARNIVATETQTQEKNIPLVCLGCENDILMGQYAPENVKKRIKEIEDEESQLFPRNKIISIISLFIVLILSMIIEGSKGMESIIGIKVCSASYWLSISIFCIFCAIVTIMNAREINSRASEKAELGIKIPLDEVSWNLRKIFQYSAYGFFAGILSAIFGIGGGMILSPVFVQLGMLPEVVSATGGLFVMFTTASSSIILMYQGYWKLWYGILFGIVGVGSSLLSIYLISGIVKKYGRPSIIVFILAGVILISGITISAVGFYQDYEKYGTLNSAQLWSFRNYCSVS